MKTTNEIRLEKLKQLISETGGLRSFCKIYGRSESQVSQWTTRAINADTGKPRNIGSASCREIEKLFNKPVGWFDATDGEQWPFKKISFDRFSALPDTAKNDIETIIINRCNEHLGLPVAPESTTKTAA